MTHPELVKKLLKPAMDIWTPLTPAQANLMHLTLGIVGEAGEISDAVKKAVVYRQKLDRMNVIEEMGDLFFYLEGLCQHLNITREEVIDANITKLQKRYADGYSDKAAQDRADKV